MNGDPLMDERDYEIILTLYELKNITRTAEKLFITQPAVTNRIKKIEKFLNGKIIVRSKNGVFFTPLGEKIIPFIQNLRSELRDMQDFARSTMGGVQGTLSLGVSVNFAHYKLPPILKHYIDKFPDVSVNIITDRSSNVFRLLQKNQVALGIVRGDFYWQEGARLISTEKIYLAFQKSINMTEIGDIPYIGYKTDSLLQNKIDNWLAENLPFRPDRSIWVDNIDTAKELVKQGIGWSILPEICLEDFGGYKTPLTLHDGRPFERKTSVLFRNALEKLPQVREFLNLLG
jgi:DNA-binding transcriptional LysR family regulator